MISIADIYVIITCKCHKFFDSSIFGSNTKNLMFDFHKENTILTKY